MHIKYPEKHTMDLFMYIKRKILNKKDYKLLPCYAKHDEKLIISSILKKVTLNDPAALLPIMEWNAYKMLGKKRETMKNYKLIF